MQLKRSISNAGLLATALSSMIGSGWLFGAMIAAKLAGPAAILSWLLGAVLIAIVALTFAELSAMLPLAGGIVRFIYFSHGNLSSFCMSYLAWLSCVAVAPTEVGAILHYAANFWPQIISSHSTQVSLSTQGYIVAIALLLFVTLINITAIKTVNKIITKIGSWKVIVPIITAVVIAYLNFDSSNFYSHGGFAPTGIHGVLMAVSSIVIFSFLGFVEATSLAGEVKNPQKVVPIAIMTAIVICSVVYLLLQVSFIAAVPQQALQNGWLNLNFSGDLGPFAGLASSFGAVYLAYFIYTDAIISPLGTSFAYTSTTARINYAMSKNRYMPKIMQRLNINSIPSYAIFFNFIIGVLLLSPFPAWEELVKFQSAAIVMAYSTGPIALIALREQAQQLQRPFLLPAHKFMCFLSLYVCNLIIFWTGWHSVWRLMLTLLVGTFMLLFWQKNKLDLNIKPAIWLLPHFIGTSIISYLGSFEGIGYLGFGVDFIVIAVFSYAVMIVANKYKLAAHETLEILEKVKAELN